MSAPTVEARVDSGTSVRGEALQGLEREVGVFVRRIKRVMTDRARAVHDDLQPASYLMLGWLAEHGPVRAATMVETFAIDKAAVSRQLHHLAELGLVDRSPDPQDGRAQLVALSDEAVRRLRRVDTERRVLLDHRLADWADDELADFVVTLGRYNASLEATADR